MNKEQKKIIDNIIKGIFSIIFSPIIILYCITYGINISVKYLFEKVLNPLYNKVCKIVRGPIPNSTVHIMGKEERWHRVNEKLLTIKEAKKLGKQYEDNGYEVTLHLSEF